MGGLQIWILKCVAWSLFSQHTKMCLQEPQMNLILKFDYMFIQISYCKTVTHTICYSQWYFSAGLLKVTSTWHFILWLLGTIQFRTQFFPWLFILWSIIYFDKYLISKYDHEVNLNANITGNCNMNFRWYFDVWTFRVLSAYIKQLQ